MKSWKKLQSGRNKKDLDFSVSQIFLCYNKELRETNMIYQVYFLDTANFQCKLAPPNASDLSFKRTRIQLF